jgi:hypothetical protein
MYYGTCYGSENEIRRQILSLPRCDNLSCFIVEQDKLSSTSAASIPRVRESVDENAGVLKWKVKYEIRLQVRNTQEPQHHSCVLRILQIKERLIFTPSSTFP